LTVLSLDTFYAACVCWVCRKPLKVDFFAAYKAVAVITGFNTAKRTLDFPELTLAPPGWFLGYKVCLHGIPAGKTTYSGLIRFHGHCRFFG
jgi:hypothetical protein